MARPRKSLEVLLMEGKSNLTKAEIVERMEQEVTELNDDIKVPPYLDLELGQRFLWYVSQLKELGIIGNVDAALLGRYVSEEKQYETIVTQLAMLDPIEDLHEYEKLNNMKAKIFTSTRQAASDLGLSVTSRGRLVVQKSKEDELSEDEQMFGGRL